MEQRPDFSTYDILDCTRIAMVISERPTTSLLDHPNHYINDVCQHRYSQMFAKECTIRIIIKIRKTRYRVPRALQRMLIPFSTCFVWCLLVLFDTWLFNSSLDYLIHPLIAKNVWSFWYIEIVYFRLSSSCLYCVLTHLQILYVFFFSNYLKLT